MARTNQIPLISPTLNVCLPAYPVVFKNGTRGLERHMGFWGRVLRRQRLSKDMIYNNANELNLVTNMSCKQLGNPIRAATILCSSRHEMKHEEGRSI
jgi:hypothetical protein